MPVHAHQRDHASNRKAGADRLRKPRRAEILGRGAVTQSTVSGTGPAANTRRLSTAIVLLGSKNGKVR
jgi:hypothetical protein